MMGPKGKSRIKLPDHPPWWRIDSLTQPGKRARWFADDAQLTRKHGYGVHLVAWWRSPCRARSGATWMLG